MSLGNSQRFQQQDVLKGPQRLARGRTATSSPRHPWKRCSQRFSPLPRIAILWAIRGRGRERWAVVQAPRRRTVSSSPSGKERFSALTSDPGLQRAQPLADESIRGDEQQVETPYSAAPLGNKRDEGVPSSSVGDAILTSCRCFRLWMIGLQFWRGYGTSSGTWRYGVIG